MLRLTLSIAFLTLLCGVRASHNLPQRSLLQTQDGPQLPVGVLPPLPYPYDALEPFVDNLTMTLHHDKHFNSYVTALPALVANNSRLQNLSLAELQRQAGTGVVSGAAAKTLQNSGGGTWNHGLFFKHLAPAGTQQAKYDTAASSDLQNAINSAFGDFNSFKAQLTTAASSVFGSGWAWLIVADNKLAITTTPNQNNPLQTALAAGTNTTAGIPILGLDVWEHAYYLKHYQNRAGWITNFFLVLNWAQISENYNYAAAGDVPDTSETPVLNSYQPLSSDLPCPCSLPAGYDVNQNDLAGVIKAAGDCPADPSEGCPSGNFGFGNTGGCGNVGCNNTGTGNTGNNNTGTGNKGDKNNGSNNTGRCLDGTDQTGDDC